MTDWTTPVEPGPPATEPAPPAAPPVSPRRRRALRVGLITALALGVAGSGVGYTATKVRDADRSVPTKVWKVPPADKSRTPQAAHSEGEDTLASRLLPIPDGYVPGPDVKEFGNDAVLTGKQAAALMKEDSRDLPPRQRRLRSQAVDKLRIQGLGVRSYQSSQAGFVAEMHISQMKNKQAVREASRSLAEFIKALDVFRKGPRIEGHRNADCHLMPKGAKRELDMMLCNAYEDDLMVRMLVYGGKPLDTKEAAKLLKKQLDHVVSPGEYI